MTSTALVATPGSAQRTRLLAVAAPALLAGYGLVRLVPGSREPGPGWMLGHTALLAGLLCFGPLLLRLHRPGRVSALGLGAALFGLVWSLVQVAVDLCVGAISSTEAAQEHHFEAIQSVPGVLPLVYQFGPLAFYLGLLTLLTHLAVRRTLPWYSPVLVLTGTLAMGASLDLMPLGGALYGLALAPLARRGSEVQ
ncbi:hypothetical protein ACFW1A_20650 [Kitasatospora sp. NPDC058965]|uniref:hypothetical protein n=1 Tax=Kitasatospora sp. NPDC058965 TaxID=3346682 RepID=UPI003681A7F6